MSTPDEPAGWQELVLVELDESDERFLPLAPSAAVYAVKSTSDPMAIHYIFELPWIVVCTCKGFRYRSDCQHARDFLDGKNDKPLDTPKLHSVD